MQDYIATKIINHKYFNKILIYNHLSKLQNILDQSITTVRSSNKFQEEKINFLFC